MPYVYSYPGEPFRPPRVLGADRRRAVLWVLTVAVAATLAAATVGVAGGPATTLWGPAVLPGR